MYLGTTITAVKLRYHKSTHTSPPTYVQTAIAKWHQLANADNTGQDFAEEVGDLTFLAKHATH